MRSASVYIGNLPALIYPHNCQRSEIVSFGRPIALNGMGGPSNSPFFLILFSIFFIYFLSHYYRRVAISLGYPETLQCNDIDCPLPQRRADLDSSDSFRAERLVAYTKLTLLLNKAINSK